MFVTRHYTRCLIYNCFCCNSCTQETTSSIPLPCSSHNKGSTMQSNCSQVADLLHPICWSKIENRALNKRSVIIFLKAKIYDLARICLFVIDLKPYISSFLHELDNLVWQLCVFCLVGGRWRPSTRLNLCLLIGWHLHISFRSHWSQVLAAFILLGLPMAVRKVQHIMPDRDEEVQRY